MVPHLDVVTINAPLHPETNGLFDDELISTMKRGAHVINTARAVICDRDAVVRALESGQLAGYAGDVWYPQPAPSEHPPANHAVRGHGSPHLRNVTIGSSALCGGHPRDPGVLFRRSTPIREEYLIVDGGALAGAGAHSSAVSS
jgi:formate dehydrogenase